MNLTSATARVVKMATMKARTLAHADAVLEEERITALWTR
jgi:hypothetical protein